MWPGGKKPLRAGGTLGVWAGVRALDGMDGMRLYSVIVLIGRKRFVAFFVALCGGSDGSRDCPWIDSNGLTFR